MSGASSAVLGAVVGAVIVVAASPYLTRLARTVPNRDDTGWWIGARATPRQFAASACGALGVGALAGAGARWSAVLPAFVALALFATPLIVIDAEHHRLPNRLVVPLAIAEAALLVGAAAVTGDWHRLLRAVEGAAAVFAVLFALNLISPRGFGFGDVKLGGLLAGYLGWFGWAYVYYGIFAGFLLGAVLAVAMLAGRRATMKTAIPFGPMLVAGSLLVVAFRLVPSLS